MLMNADDQLLLSNPDTEQAFEDVHQWPLDQTHRSVDENKVYWNLHVWRGKPDCPGQADKSWTDWVYHDCEDYRFKQLNYSPGSNGIYRLCVYNEKKCDGELIFDTSYAKDCVQVKPKWGQSWKIIKASENCS